MFRCQRCGIVTPPCVPAELVVVESRLYVHPPRREAHRPPYCRRHEKIHKGMMQDDPGGAGRQIVREVRVCPPCKLALTPDLSEARP